MTAQMQDKTVVITGAGSGFGKASALLFARQGAKVIVGDLNLDTAQATADEIRALGASAKALQVDVAQEASVESFFAAAIDTYGRIDCAFNNAGILGPVKEMHEVTLEEYERIMAVNSRGVWLCMRAEIRAMLAQQVPQGGHSIVNTASVAGLVASAMLPAYGASKHAVVGMTRSAARSYGRRGIRINAVCPGPVETPLAGPLFASDKRRDMLLERQALDHFGTPEEVAEMVVWLSSPAASLVTGTPMRVDAGALT
jgi:NAD(P)-dependent dehydrogenase (short-subunit alcohol dehydrogenase family)